MSGHARVDELGGGGTHLVLWLYRLVFDKESMASCVRLNSADDWLHVVPGVSMIGPFFLLT
ncbi:DUF4383 domain-containing protein [Brachybacterium sp. P6-10-X1]|uniref:DUF4383 domain-containing protein n=1 Tax=Brachybacterium sp. P6-10-X1 TaxID=1903186 RepID=UPI00352ACC63